MLCPPCASHPAEEVYVVPVLERCGVCGHEAAVMVHYSERGHEYVPTRFVPEAEVERVRVAGDRLANHLLTADSNEQRQAALARWRDAR